MNHTRTEDIRHLQHQSGGKKKNLTSSCIKDLPFVFFSSSYQYTRERKINGYHCTGGRLVGSRLWGLFDGSYYIMQVLAGTQCRDIQYMLQMEELSIDNVTERMPVCTCWHSAMCLILNQSSERHQAAVMRCTINSSTVAHCLQSNARASWPQRPNSKTSK